MIELNEVEENINSENTTDLKSFFYLEDGSITFSLLNTRYVTKKLDKGIYDLWAEDAGRNVEPRLAINDDKESLNNDLDFYFEDKLKSIYSKFFMPDIKDKVNKLGYNHKVGVLLHGKQGTGKTSLCKKYFKSSVSDYNAIVFNIKSPAYIVIWWDFIKKIRKIQNNPIVIFIDEFDEYFENTSAYEPILKRVLDGLDSIDNCFFMMTTNYIDKIPDTIKNRPSRVKYKIEVGGITDEKLIHKFLQQSFEKISLEVDFAKEVSKMKNYTVDELKQWILDKIMDLETEEKNVKKLGFSK